MKEYVSQTGGRYCYNEDLINLQELALAYSSLFDGCDNFIISGCQVSDNSISAGTVWINGKIRHFTGANSVSSYPQYIYEANTIEPVDYANNTVQNGRVIYGCQISSTPPTTLDPVTNAAPGYIEITQNGGLHLREMFYGRYCLLLQSAFGSQVVKDAITFNNIVNVQGILTLNGALKLSSSNVTTLIQHETNALLLQATINNDTQQLKLSSKKLEFFVNGSSIVQFGVNGMSTTLPVNASKVTAGVLVLDNHNIHTTAASNASVLNINLISPDNNYFRDTVIGNGKGVAIISVIGASKHVQVDGTLNIKNAVTLQGAIQWVSSQTYASMLNNALNIVNTLGAININATQINLTGEISDNGVLLSNKYVTSTKLTTMLMDYVLADNCWTKTEMIAMFAAKKDGLSQFITEEHTATFLRNEIDAVSMRDVTNRCAQLSNYLSDMATSEEAKAAIRKNIGAAAATIQTDIKDTGWVEIHPGKLAVRQYGKVVCIQGFCTPCHDGAIWFTIPNTIQAPGYNVDYSYSINKMDLVATILAGEKTVRMKYCNRSLNNVPINVSITYMVN